MEKQDIEYKQSWRDEYIKWISGFANANGGKIYIGINDSGTVTGVENAKRLLEEIPNKTRDVLGIIVDGNLKSKARKNYLEIIVEAYPNPVSYKGEYHYRTGSTKQELKGAALDKFILRKLGLHWDSVPQPNLKITEFSKEAILYFKSKAAETQRINPEILKDKPDILLEKLHLKTNIGYYKRATILLFHNDPEKYITGAYIKIGFFNTDTDLVYQDEIHGTLFEQVDRTIELLLTKYLKAYISYKGIYRIEQYPILESAIREAVLNAVIHKNYSGGNPIQISVYDNKLMIYNDGELPETWTIEKLQIKHPSKPYNPDVANAFFRAGIIEAWGRGTIKIIEECKRAKTQVPEFFYNNSEFLVQFNYPKSNIQPIKIKQAATTNNQKIISYITNNEKVTIAELAAKIGLTERTIKRLLKELQDTNKLMREGSDKSGKWIVV